MKKSSLGFISVIVIAAILSLTACGRGQSLPEPAVKLPVELSSFDVAKYDYDFDLGDYQCRLNCLKRSGLSFRCCYNRINGLTLGSFRGGTIRLFWTLLTARDGI